MLSEHELTLATQRLCHLRGWGETPAKLAAARREILQLQELYQAISFAKGQTQLTTSDR